MKSKSMLQRQHSLWSKCIYWNRTWTREFVDVLKGKVTGRMSEMPLKRNEDEQAMDCLAFGC